MKSTVLLSSSRPLSGMSPYRYSSTRWILDVQAPFIHYCVIGVTIIALLSDVMDSMMLTSPTSVLQVNACVKLIKCGCTSSVRQL